MILFEYSRNLWKRFNKDRSHFVRVEGFRRQNEGSHAVCDKRFLFAGVIPNVLIFGQDYPTLFTGSLKPDFVRRALMKEVVMNLNRCARAT